MDVPLTEEMIAQQSPEAQAIIRSLLEIIVQQQEKIESLPSQADQLTIQTRTLTARVQELEAMLDLKKKTPLNSSVPPSTEHPHAKSLPAKPATKRPRGGQPGHPKHERPLLDSEDSDEVVPLKPTVCRRCGKALEGVDSEPLRHQVWEIPQPQPIVIEDQRQRLTCACGCTTCAPLPEGVPEHTSGPRLIATAAFLMACCGLSKARAAFTLATLFGVPVSPALTVKFQEHATAALAPCYEELKAALPERATANCDETPTKQGSNKAWIWVATTQVFTVFVIALARAATVVQGLLGVRYRGVVTTDRYASYNAYNRLRQICRSHLKRDFQALVDAGGEAEVVGQKLLSYLKLVFDHWHDYLSGKISRGALKRRIHRDVFSPMWQTINAGREASHKPTRALCRDLHIRWQQLWMFLEYAGVDPTNNRAEQVLRHAVIWRKLSFGTQSAAGSRFVETMLSVIETCRQQNRDLLDVLTTAVEAYQHQQPPLSLLKGA